MREWFELRGQRYLRVDWVDAGALERDRRYVEVPAADVLGMDARDCRVFRERLSEEYEPGEESRPATLDGDRPAPGPSGEATTSSYEEEEPRAWIEIELQDMDGKPVPSALCRLVLTSGKVVERLTDKYGVIRVDGIDAGKCEVSFPKLADAVWAPV